MQGDVPLQGMEVVIAASAVFQLTLRLFDKYANKVATNSHVEDNGEQVSSQNSEGRLSRSAKKGSAEEGSIGSLEARLADLRSQAKALNSPNTFVQYARVSREANKVEKVLKDRRESEGIYVQGPDIEDIAKLFSSAVGSNTTGILYRRIRLSTIKLLIRISAFMALWTYFSWFSAEDSEKRYSVELDCHAFRPLAFMFVRKIPVCMDVDWICSAKPLVCKIPFSFAFSICNVVLSVIVKTFT